VTIAGHPSESSLIGIGLAPPPSCRDTTSRNVPKWSRSMSSRSEFGPGLTKDPPVPMLSPGRLIRLKESSADEKRRVAAQIEVMIADFDRMANDLECEIQAEQNRAGIHDLAHYAYPTYAKAAVARRDNLKRSIQDLKVQLANFKIAVRTTPVGELAVGAN
jgi:hypothetical protein